MSNVIETTYCDKCGDELESSQIGMCEACRPRAFSELSEKAKQKAREEYTSGDYPGYDWWDNVYEDAIRMAKIIGVTFDNKTVNLVSGKTRYDPMIYFFGFGSQSDGACFAGGYCFNPSCVKEMNAETDDVELIRIATELYTMQLARRLLGLEHFTATIATHGRYSHSGTIEVNVNSEDENDEHSQIGNDLEDAVTQLMRDFADWIYKQLEAENDYLYSDEYVDEELSQDDKEFDEDGALI